MVIYMKEYQFRKEHKLVLPSEVYYQCLWVVRDMERLKELAEEPECENRVAEEVLQYEGVQFQVNSLEIPPEVAEAKFKLGCIRRALEVVPETYREAVLQNILQRGGGYNNMAHENTWKKWKQRFIYVLAENLCLISQKCTEGEFFL